MMFFLQYIFNLLKFKKLVSIGLLSNIQTNSSFEGYNRIGKFCTFKGHLGHHSYIGDRSFVFGDIGNYTSIASNVHIIIGRHPIKAPYVSTSPMFYAKQTVIGQSYTNNKQYFVEYIYSKQDYPVSIGNDCWIGANVSIVEGVTIADGAVILAGAVVTKDIPAFAIVGGIPANIIGYRYDDDTISKLLKLKWWNKDESWIKKFAPYFCDIQTFIAKTDE